MKCTSKSVHGVPRGTDNANVIKATRRYETGGVVRGRQSDDDGRGGWSAKDGSSRPDGKPFARGGKAKC